MCIKLLGMRRKREVGHTVGEVEVWTAIAATQVHRGDTPVHEQGTHIDREVQCGRAIRIRIMGGSILMHTHGRIKMHLEAEQDGIVAEGMHRGEVEEVLSRVKDSGLHKHQENIATK